MRQGASPAPCGGCCLNICRAQALATARILRIGLRASCLTQVGPASQTPFPLWGTAVCIARRQALYLLLFVCLGEAPDISLLSPSPLTLRSTAAPCGLRLRFSSDPSLPVTKGCLREQALGRQASPAPGVFAAALPALWGRTECGFADWPGAAACCWAVSPACLLCELVSDGGTKAVSWTVHRVWTFRRPRVSHLASRSLSLSAIMKIRKIRPDFFFASSFFFLKSGESS